MASQLLLEGNTSLRDEYVKVSLILGNFYPHYEFIKLFSNLHTPPTEAPGRASLGGGGLFFSIYSILSLKNGLFGSIAPKMNLKELRTVATLFFLFLFDLAAKISESSSKFYLILTQGILN